MSEPALSLAFFDPEHGIHGSARAGVTLLFEGTHSEAIAESPEVDAAGDGFRARVGGRLDLVWRPVGAPVEIGGARGRIARVEGTVDGNRIACLGTITETHEPPAWEELDAVRGISAVFDEGTALLAIARRPRGAAGHDSDRIDAALVLDGTAVPVAEARISTVYDGEGRQRSAGLELHLTGEDWPHRGSGTVIAGTTLQLERLQVNAAVFSWRLDGRIGAGAYDVVYRAEPAVA